MNKIRFGIVGLGFGVNHVHTADTMPEIDIVAIADMAPKPGRLGNKSMEEFARDFGAKAYADGIKMMEREKLDAISIAVSPKYRNPLVLKAAELGLSIFMEKPIAANMEQGRVIAEICKKHNTVMMNDFVMSYMPAVVRLRELLSTTLGQGLVLNCDLMIPTARNGNLWTWDIENGNGVINENTCHFFDTVRTLMGDIDTLYAEGKSYMGNPVEDGVAITMRFKNRSSAVLTGGGLAVPAMKMEPYIHIYTENGEARLNGTGHMFNSLTWATADDSEAHHETWELPPRNQILRYAMRHFFDCIKSGTPTGNGVPEGLQALAIAMAVRESLTTHSSVKVTWS